MTNSGHRIFCRSCDGLAQFRVIKGDLDHKGHRLHLCGNEGDSILSSRM